MSLRALVSSFIFFGSLVASASQMTVCGVVQQDRAGYTIVGTASGERAQLEAANPKAEQALYQAAQPLFIPTIGRGPSRHVCVTGTVVLNDENRGLVLEVVSPSQITMDLP